MEDRDLRVRILEIEASRYLRQGKYELAEERYREELGLLLEIQKEAKVRIHKGTPFHNLGISLLFRGKTDNAIMFIVFALIEDLISSTKQTETDLLPASDVLRSFCGATWEDLKPIEDYVFQEKEKRQIFSPDEIEPDIRQHISLIQSNYRRCLEPAWRFEVEAQRAIERKDFESATNNYNEWLELLYKCQKRREVRLHKGYVIFRLGIALYRWNKIQEAVDYFIQAYIEDVISSRDLSRISQTAAYGVLKQLGVGLDFLEGLRVWACREKDENRDVGSPKILKERFLSEEEVAAPQKIAPIEDTKLVRVKRPADKLTIEDLPGTYTERVFIGGAYADESMQILREIASYVKELGYRPVIARDYDAPRDDEGKELLNIHDFDILLMHMCRYAIFEVSKAAGQYNEIEWAIRFLRKRTLGVCGKGKESEISTMIRDLFREIDEDIFFYSSIDSLKDYIGSKLPERKAPT